jgi:excisionase family DNA binding protein
LEPPSGKNGLKRPASENTRQIWGPKELAHYLGVSYATVLKRLRSGELPGFRIGKLYRIRPEDARAIGRADREA